MLGSRRGRVDSSLVGKYRSGRRNLAEVSECKLYGVKYLHVDGINPLSLGLGEQEVVKARAPPLVRIGMNCSGRQSFSSSILNCDSVSGNTGLPEGSSKSQTPYLMASVSGRVSLRNLSTYRSRSPPERTFWLGFSSKPCSPCAWDFGLSFTSARSNHAFNPVSRSAPFSWQYWFAPAASVY